MTAPRWASALLPWPPRVTHMGVSLTRMAYAATLFADMAQVYRWRDTSFDPSTAWVGRFVVPAAMLALALFGAGLATRLSTVACIALLHVVYRHIPETYALDRITLLVTFVFLLGPAPRALALDVRLRKARPSPLEIVPAWFSLSLLLCIEIVYGPSVIYKLRSTIWREGLAVWLPVTLPHFSAGRLPRSLESAVALQALGYLTLVFEVLFPLVLLRPLRRWMIVIGVGLHLGIAAFLPIPLFGIGFASLYPFLVDWGPIARRLRLVDVTPNVTPITTGAPPPGRRWAPLVPFALPLGLAAGELLALVPARFLPAVVYIDPYLSLVGLNRYALYADFNFVIPKPIVRFEVRSGDRVIDVPTFDARGYPEVTGRYWCHVAIGGLRWPIGEPAGDVEVSRYLRGALTRAGVGDAEVSIYGRDVSIPLRMDPRLADDVASRPWALIGTGVYRGGHSEISWKAGAPLTTAGRAP